MPPMKELIADIDFAISAQVGVSSDVLRQRSG